MSELKIIYSHSLEAADQLEASVNKEGFEMIHDYMIEEFYNPRDGERVMHVSVDISDIGRLFYNMLKIQRDLAAMAKTNPQLQQVIEDVAFRFEADEKSAEFAETQPESLIRH